jgi:hypothetical protein
MDICKGIKIVHTKCLQNQLSKWVFYWRFFEPLRATTRYTKNTKWFAMQVALPPFDRISNDWSSGFSACNWGHYGILHQGKWETSCWERQDMLLGGVQSTNTSRGDFFGYVPERRCTWIQVLAHLFACWTLMVYLRMLICWWAYQPPPHGWWYYFAQTQL